MGKWFGLLLGLFPLLLQAQVLDGPAMDYSTPEEYEIGGVTVSGADNTDANAVKLFAGLKVGNKIVVPGDDIAKAIKNLWTQKLFSDIRIEAAEIRGSTIFLNIIVEERDRLSRFKFSDGVTRSEADKLRDQLSLRVGMQINEDVLSSTEYKTKRYYVDKGFLKTTVSFDLIPDTVQSVRQTLGENAKKLLINVDRGPKIKIKDINFHGAENIPHRKLRKVLKNTKRKRWWNPTGGSKFIRADYNKDKKKIVDLYNKEGYRNAEITNDTMYYAKRKKITLDIYVDEGNQFYYRNVRWVGNTKHKSAELSDIMGIEKGDTYNKELLESRLYMNQTGRDVSSLYMNDGYLSFYPDPVETIVGRDSIDLEIRIREGRQYRVNKVIIKGNSKTNDHVIRREIRTRPGDLFSREDIIRTQRELVNLGYFDPQALGVNPIPDERTGTVDLEYTVEETPSDRLELSGGWGAGRVVVSLGVSLTNFSIRNAFKKGGWSPIPAGDGQTFNIRLQTNGRFYQNLSASFVEPWLGGRKPTALSLSTYYSQQTNGILDREDPSSQILRIIGGTVGIGKRLTWPDDYFVLRYTIGYQHYDLNNWNSLFSFRDGQSNVLSFQTQFSRNSVDQPFFPRSGSAMSISVKATPPWSLWVTPGQDYPNLTSAQRYQWAEFHKWKFTTQWYNRLTRTKSGHDLVLAVRGGLGFLGNYNDALGESPFERYYLGGSALTGFQLDGREIVGLRGYDDLSLAPSIGNFLISKYTTELRFPLSLNPSAMIYGTTFIEAGNTWNDFDNFDPFSLYRAAGVGLRLNLPMFGPMGLDYGWRLDDVPDAPFMSKGQFHFTIGIDLGEL